MRFEIRALGASDRQEVSQQLKPQIPERGLGGVPIRDEIELALPIEPAAV